MHAQIAPLALTLPDLNLTSWAGIAAATAIIASCWRTIGMWANRLADLVICRVVVKDDAARAVMSQVWAKGRRSPFGLRLFGGVTSFVFPKRRVEVVAFESVTSEPLLFWVGRVPLLIGAGFHRGQQTDPNIGNYNDSISVPVTIRYIRGTLDIDQFVAGAISAYNELRQKRTSEAKSATGPRRFNVIRMHGPGRAAGGMIAMGGAKADTPAPLGGSTDATDLVAKLQRNEMRLLTWSPDDLVERSTDARPFVNHPVSPAILAQLDRVSIWLKREKWYRSKGVPWRLGCLLFGPPGSGKDTIVRNVAMQHDLPVYALDLSSYDNRSFTEDWKVVMQNAPAIALVSDIDAVFKGRENVAAKDKTRDTLTFDHLLNTISGVGSSEGVCLCVTTNHVESLDPALGVPYNGHGRSTRPGRIDIVIEVGAMQESERRALAALMLGDWPDQVEPAVRAGEGEMAAQFQERCAQLALRLIEERGLVTEGGTLAA